MTVKIIGHRGSGRTENNPFAQGLPPQHTKLSFQQVIDKGADGVEFDIFVSKDNIPVIIHRQGAKDLKISELAADQITKIPLPDSQYILTLEECLIFLAELYARLPDRELLINAELKGPDVVAQTVKVIEEVASRYPLNRDRIIFDALEWERLSEMKALDPQAHIMPALSTARLFNMAGQKPGAEKKYDAHVMAELEQFIKDNDCCGIDVMTADIRPEMIALATRMNVGFCSYPQGPHPQEEAALIHQNMGLLEEFSKQSHKPVILKVEDVEATRALVEDYKNNRPPPQETVERMMGMRLT